MKSRFSILGALLFCTGAFLLPARAATFTVVNSSDSGTGSLRDALSLANANADADTIVFDSSAFSATSPQTIVLSSGELPLAHDVTVLGPGAGLLGVSGNNASRVLHVTGGRATLSGLSILSGAILTGDGGGVLVNGGTTLSMNGCVVAGNNAGGTKSNGGGIAVAGTLNLNACTVSGNTASAGGGIVTTTRSATISLNDCFVATNTASAGNDGGIGNSGTMTMTGCTVAGNIAKGTDNTGNGGGVLNNGTLSLTNCTVVGNSSSGGGFGGGGLINTGALTLANCTVADNTASTISGGIYNFSGGSLSLQASIVARNSVTTATSGSNPNIQSDAATSTFSDGDSNLIGDNTGGPTFTGTHNQLGTATSPINPGFDPAGLKFNGGPTPTLALVAGSPAIDANFSNALVVDDQRGVLRDARPDIGAFEFVPPLVDHSPHISVTPQNASDKVGAKRTFELVANDADGEGDITEMWLLINDQLDYNDGATLLYLPKSGLLYLRSGGTFLRPIHIGSSAGANEVLDNGAIRVVGREVVLAVGATTRGLSIPATIRGGLVGQNLLFGRVVDAAGNLDPATLPGESGFVRQGSYLVQSQFASATNHAPTLSKLSPPSTTTRLNTSGIAPLPQKFVFFIKDEDGAGDIESMWFLAGPKRDWSHSATFVFIPRTRRLFLRSDDGSTFVGGARIGTVGILENSQVRLDLSKVEFLVYADGKSLGLRLPLQAKTGLLGQNKVWLRVQDRGGLTSAGGDDQGFVQSGTWTVNPPATADASPTKPSGGSS